VFNSLSGSSPPTIDHEIDASHITRLIARQKHSGRGYVVGFAKPRHGRAVIWIRETFCTDVNFRGTGQNFTRCNCIAYDVVCSVVRRAAIWRVIYTTPALLTPYAKSEGAEIMPC